MRRIYFTILSLIFAIGNVSAQENFSDLQDAYYEGLYIKAMQDKIKGDYQSSFNTLTYLDKQKPNQPAVLNEIAKLLNATQDYIHAAEYAQMAVDIDTTCNYSYCETAISAYVMSDHQEKVLPIYDKILANNPNDVDTRFNKFTLLSTLGRHDEALAEADKIKTKDDDVLYEIDLRKVAIYADLKKIKRAFKLANTLYKKNPNQARTLYVLSHLYKMKGENEEAISYCERATKCSHGSNFLFLLANLYRENKMDSLYASAMLRGFASQEIDEDAKVQQVYQLGRDKDIFDNANWMSFLTGVYYSLLQQYPANPEIVSLSESYYAHIGNFKLGRELLRRYVSDYPGTEYIWNRLLTYERADTTESNDAKSRKILELCKRARKDLPNLLVYGVIQGQYEYALKDYKSALATFNETFTQLDALDENIKPNVVYYRHSALNGIANCYYALDSISKAFIVYDQILSEDPDNDLALNNYAYFLAKEGLLLAKAERMSVKSLNKNPLNATYLDTYAYILLREGKYQEAMFVMERCIESYANDNDDQSAEIHDHYGDILFNVGRVDEAIAEWNKALELKPDNTLIKKKIDTKSYIIE